MSIILKVKEKLNTFLPTILMVSIKSDRSVFSQTGVYLLLTKLIYVVVVTQRLIVKM